MFIYMFLFVEMAFAQKDTSKTFIDILNADVLRGERVNGVDVQKLIGRVALHQNGANFYCDSALFFERTNSIHAFGRIHIKQGDSLSLYGDTLYYDGNTQIATVLGRVRLIEKQVELVTSKLVYNRVTQVAFYTDSATTTSNADQLSSRKGYYYSNTKKMAFRDNVVIVNPEYTLKSDTLIMDTEKDITYFYGPSEIISKDSYIYCEDGWYDKPNDKAEFNKNAYVISNNHILRGDKLYYERKKGYGKAIKNVSIEDTVERVVITGHFAESYQNIKRYFVTDSAQVIRYFDNDTLYMHADTLLSFMDNEVDENRIISAFHHVKFFKKDMQGACDSSAYYEKDSLMRMYVNPVVWSDENQITADYIEIKMAQGNIYEMHMKEKAMLVTEIDTTMYNQISGDNMDAFFIENDLRRVEVLNAGNIIYFIEDEKDGVIGLEKIESQDVTIRIQNKQIQQVVPRVKPRAVMHPIHKVPEDAYKLPGFSWQSKRRPKDRWDIFKHD